MDRDEGFSLGDRLRRLRRARGLTGTELARRAGVSESYVRLLESGIRQSAGVGTLRKLAEVLGVSLDTLVAGEAGPIEQAEARLRREHAIQLLEESRDALQREPVSIGSDVLVTDRGAVPAEVTTWESGGDVLHAVPARALGNRLPETCFVVTVGDGELPSQGLVRGVRVLFEEPEPDEVPEDESVVLASVYGRVRLGVYRARGQRVELAGDGQPEEVWPDDDYRILGHYLGHWSFNSG